MDNLKNCIKCNYGMANEVKICPNCKQLQGAVGYVNLACKAAFYLCVAGFLAYTLVPIFFAFKLVGN